MIIKTELNQDKEFTNLMVKAYILKNINTEGYDMEPTPENVIKIFKSEFEWQIKNKGIRNAFIEWCEGVPSALSLEYYYNEVNEILENEFNALLYNKILITDKEGTKKEYRQNENDNKQFKHYLNLIMVNLFELANQQEELK